MPRIVACGVVVGFPLLTALALQHVTSAHTIVFLGLLPLSTAAFAVLRGGERPRPAQEKQAAPLQMQHLEQVIDWLESEVNTAQANADQPGLLRARRDAALILLGFWRGRGDCALRRWRNFAV